jgi:hypothetical protein
VPFQRDVAAPATTSCNCVHIQHSRKGRHFASEAFGFASEGVSLGMQIPCTNNRIRRSFKDETWRVLNCLNVK